MKKTNIIEKLIVLSACFTLVIPSTFAQGSDDAIRKSVLDNIPARIFSVETYELREFNDRSEAEAAVYNSVYYAKTAAELTLPLAPTKKLYRFALEAAVASSDLDKFKFVLDHTPVYTNPNHLVDTIIIAAESTKVEESKLIQMLEYYISCVLSTGAGGKDLRKWIGKWAVWYAARAEFYEVAEFLLSHNAEITKLDKDCLFSLTEDDKNYFNSFEWLFVHGGEVDLKLVGSILCQQHFKYNLFKNRNFDNQENINAAINLLIQLGVTSEHQVEEILQRCNIIANIVETSSQIVKNYLRAKVSFDEIKFILDNGAELTAWDLDYLVDYPELEVVKLVLNKAVEQKLDYNHLKNYFATRIGGNMHHCNSNIALAQYLGIEKHNNINWNQCEGLKTHLVDENLSEHSEL